MLALVVACIVPGTVVAESTKDSWLNSLSAHVRAQARYPLQAGPEGGKAKVLFRIDRSGHLVSAVLVESTGDLALDKEALDMVERAQPFAAAPADVEDAKLTMVLPVVFRPRPPAGIIVPIDLSPEATALRAKLNGICRGC
ncbi:energy transducer TonB [Bradyrhizobium sp. STM 3809]|uniref:energy transducer TonB family protein n=1 Tax=Bradyrhizobium sp. STM 3809 TaxID=551936 RepID=UPI000240812D|nr:energy transducer TonB [Bradyrhizobium sp. STM 3809]CCD97827.1 conserved hypothetical protein [Bradyrhizobium sp. STM 3809]